MAWNVAGQRVSNIVRFRLGASVHGAQEPRLKLVEEEPIPGETLPLLKITAYRATERDPAPRASHVAYPQLVVNGHNRAPTAMLWCGPDGPLPVGGRYAYFVHLDNYAPPIEPGKPHVIVAKVGKQPSNSITLRYDRSLSRSWDRANPGARGSRGRRLPGLKVTR